MWFDELGPLLAALSMQGTGVSLLGGFDFRFRSYETGVWGGLTYHVRDSTATLYIEVAFTIKSTPYCVFSK